MRGGTAESLPPGGFERRLSRHWHHFNRAKRKVWYGDLYGASIALSSFYDGVDIHVVIAGADSGRSSVERSNRFAIGWPNCRRT
jgi:hypothetical protein